jgi:hypothetical protein
MREHVRAQFDADGAIAGQALFLRHLGVERGDVVDMQPVDPDIVDPARFARQRPVGVAQHQSRFGLVAGPALRCRKDHRLRADRAGPAIVAAEIEMMLGRDRDHDIDACRAQFRADAIEPGAMFGLREGRERRARNRVGGWIHFGSSS